MLAPEDNKTLINYKVTDAETQANSRIQKFVAIDNNNADYSIELLCESIYDN